MDSKVVPNNVCQWFRSARAGTVPPAHTLARARTEPSSGGWPMVSAMLAGVITMSLLMVSLGRRDRAVDHSRARELREISRS
jgi:hypothetical protein